MSTEGIKGLILGSGTATAVYSLHVVCFIVYHWV